MVGTPSLREKKKAETRARILEVSNELFHERGFDAATLEEICTRSGVSKRTFFRYFKDKEALVMPNRDIRLDRFIELLSQANPNASAFMILRQITRVFAAEYMENREGLLAQQAIIATSPALLAREREIDADWEREIASLFRSRLPPGDASARRAEVLAGATIGAVRASMRHWFGRKCVDDLDVLGQETLDSLERGFSLDD